MQAKAFNSFLKLWPMMFNQAIILSPGLPRKNFIFNR